MKNIFFSCLIFFSVSLFSYSQNPLGRPNFTVCEKKAQKDFFKLKKEGWLLEAESGSADMKSVLTDFYLLHDEVDSKKKPIYVFGESSTVANSKLGGYLEATDKAKVELAGQILVRMDSAINAKLSSPEERGQALKVLNELKIDIAKKIFKANVLYKLYRTSETNSLVPENQIETLVKIYQDKKYLYDLGGIEALRMFKDKYGLSEDEIKGLFK